MKQTRNPISKGDSVKFNVSVSNAGDSEISEIALKASLPEKFNISENGEYKLSLAANETKTYIVAANPAAEATTAAPATTVTQQTTAAQNTNGTSKSSVAPKTGDTPPYLFMLILPAAVILAAKSRKNKKALSVMITAAALGAFTMQNFTVITDAETVSGNATATADFLYDGVTETITVQAVYEYESAGETKSQVLDYNKQALRDVTGVSNARQPFMMKL